MSTLVIRLRDVIAIPLKRLTWESQDGSYQDWANCAWTNCKICCYELSNYSWRNIVFLVSKFSSWIAKKTLCLNLIVTHSTRTTSNWPLSELFSLCRISRTAQFSSWEWPSRYMKGYTRPLGTGIHWMYEQLANHISLQAWTFWLCSHVKSVKETTLGPGPLHLDPRVCMIDSHTCQLSQYIRKCCSADIVILIAFPCVRETLGPWPTCVCVCVCVTDSHMMYL